MEHEVSFLSFLLFQLCVVYSKGNGNIYYHLLYVLMTYVVYFTSNPNSKFSLLLFKRHRSPAKRFLINTYNFLYSHAFFCNPRVYPFL